MEQMAEWISLHVLSLWTLCLVLALLGGDLARRRIARPQATGTISLQPRTCFLIALAMLVLFGVLVWNVREQTGLVQFDIALAANLHRQLPLPLLRGISWITHGGDPWLLAFATVAIGLWLALTRHWQRLATWCVALGGIALIDHGIKDWIQRERPLHSHGYIVELGWSFPSGHAAGSLVFYGLLACGLSGSMPRRWHRLVVAAAITLVTVIGISRIVLQVHYFSDVLAGYALGAAWLMLCVGATRYLMDRQRDNVVPATMQNLSTEPRR